MKRKKLLTHLTGGVLAFLLSAGAVGCLATGFQLPPEVLSTAIPVCALTSLVGAAALLFHFGGYGLLGVLALSLGFAVREGSLIDHLGALAYHISGYYDAAYGTGTLWFGTNPTGPVTLGPMAIGIVIALLACRTHCRRKAGFPTLLAAALPLGLCMVVTDTVPAAGYLFLLLLGMAVVLLTTGRRRQSQEQAQKRTLFVALPAAAALALLFLIAPQESYVNHPPDTEQLEHWLMQAESWVQSLAEDFSGAPQIVPKHVNLAALGRQAKLGIPVMQVTDSQGGLVYLREQDYNAYDGSGWTADAHREESFSVSTAHATRTVTVETFRDDAVFYLPYYPVEPVVLSGGRLENEDSRNRYTISASDGALPEPPTPQQLRQYLELPEFTAQWAQTLAASITAGETTREGRVAEIARYVRSAAVYDLQTDAMPAGNEDFAQWFLEESDTGYCVHFATAATVLLRGAGIPARYVTGYLAACTPMAPSQVTSDDAHAWAEYYDGENWQILEATPPDLTGTAPSVPAATSPVPPTDVPPTAAVNPISPTEVRPGPTATTANPHPTQALPAPTDMPDGPPTHIPVWLLVFPSILLAAAGIVCQWLLRRQWKMRRWNLGKPNAMALNRYRQLRQMSRVTKQKLPEEIEVLAQRAAFSQYSLQPEELKQFDDCRAHLLAHAKESGPLRQLMYRLVFAIL